MTTAHDNSKSILPDVQRQEKELLSKLEAAKDEARGIVDKARSDALKLIQDEEARVTEEIAAQRKAADQARREAYAAQVADADGRLQGQREAAMGRVPEMAKQAMDFFLPKGGQS